MAKKKTVRKKTTTAQPKPQPATEKLKVYFITEDARAFLLEYLQTSPAGQYSPTSVMNVANAIRNAGSGEIEVKP